MTSPSTNTAPTAPPPRPLYDSKRVNITPLGTPGTDSNYLDWAFAVETYFEATGLDYLLQRVEPKDRPTSWIADNKLFCSTIVQVSSEANYKYIRKLKGDARGMWLALKAAHEDQSSGGCIHLLYKLLLTRMDEGDDVKSHINKMQETFERFDALISDSNPLVPDNLFAAALIISLTPNLLNVVRPFMSRPSTTSEDVIHTLTQDNAFAKTRRGTDTPDASASKAKPSNNRGTGSKPSYDSNLRCTFCNVSGHDLPACNNARRVLEEHKSERTSSNKDKLDKSEKYCLKPKKAGKVATSSLNDDNDSSDEAELFTARSASLIQASGASPLPVTKDRDANIDSGCSQSMTPHPDQVVHGRPDQTRVRLADNSVIRASHRGDLTQSIQPGVSHSVLLVPSLHEPLLSVAGLADDGLVTVFDDKNVSLYHRDAFNVNLSPVSVGDRRGNLYYLPEKVNTSSASSFRTSVNQSLLDWHCTFSHIGLKPLKRHLKSLNIHPSIVNETDVQQCSICVQGKMHCRPFTSRSRHCATERGQIIHSDVCSFEAGLREGFTMWATFIDDYSKDITVYPMKSKSQTFQFFKQFKAAFENTHKCKLRTLVSDNSGEYMSDDFQTYLRDAGLHHEPGPPHSPQLNGVAERANRSLCDRLRCLLISAKVPKSFWADALHHLIFSINSVPCYGPAGFIAPNAVNDVPLVDPAYLHPFGCLSWYKVPDAN